MQGINKATGKALKGLSHLKQSLQTLLSTPIGTRIMRRDYGSKLPRLIDAPMNADTVVELFAATAEAIELWEPRFSLQSVSLESAEPGKVVLTLHGVYLPEGEEVTMEGLEVTA